MQSSRVPKLVDLRFLRCAAIRMISGLPPGFRVQSRHLDYADVAALGDERRKKRFARLSLGFSKKLDNLCAAVGMHMAYYNYCWWPRRLGKSGRKMPTPALAAGLTKRLWTFDNLFDEVMI